MTELKISIAHLPDRERPVAEVWAGDAQFGEVSCEAGDLCIEIYPNPAGGPWRFSFEEATKAFERAKERLADVTGAVPRERGYDFRARRVEEPLPEATEKCR